MDTSGEHGPAHTSGHGPAHTSGHGPAQHGPATEHTAAEPLAALGEDSGQLGRELVGSVLLVVLMLVTTMLLVGGALGVVWLFA